MIDLAELLASAEHIAALEFHDGEMEVRADVVAALVRVALAAIYLVGDEDVEGKVGTWAVDQLDLVLAALRRVDA